jgi:predicted Zn-dependent protease
MTSTHDPLTGIYYDGRRPIGVPATLSLDGSGATLARPDAASPYRLSALQVSPRIGKAHRFIQFPDGGQFQCPDSERLDSLPQAKSEGLVAWLEARVVVAVLGIVGIVAGMLTGYFYGLPRAAEYVAARVPVETERVIGDKGLAWLEAQQWLQPTAVSEALQAVIRQDFDTLRQGLAQERHFRLEFRNAPRLGANALALPGGTIVVTDALVKLAGSRQELAAVLAHEIGHIEHRHTLRLMLQNSVVVLVVATVVGDAATTGVAGVPALLAQAKYSREFESQADEFAFALLRRHGISPESFAAIMIRMARTEPKAGAGLQSGFLSTHPLTQERIERARAAGRAGSEAP